MSDPRFEAAWGFVDRADSLAEPAAVARQFGELAGAFGFDRFVVTNLPPPAFPLEPFMLADAWPEGWHQRYSSGRYFDRDPVGQYALLRNRPFLWREVPKTLYRGRGSALVMGEAQEFGLVDGFCVPLIAPSGRRAVVALSARHRVDLSTQDCVALHMLALTAYARLVALKDRPEPDLVLLSTREREVMTWTAAGKSAWEISRILGISERTVKFHLESVRRRLDAANTVHAVVRCMLLGQIQPY